MLWSKDCIITEIYRTPEVAGNPRANPPVSDREATLTTGATFQINNTKLYVPIVALAISDNIKFLEHLKQGCRRAVSWNKYSSVITTQHKNNNLDCMIDPVFRNINRLFVLSL